MKKSKRGIVKKLFGSRKKNKTVTSPTKQSTQVKKKVKNVGPKPAPRQIDVEQAKFSTAPRHVPAPASLPQHLPANYNLDRLVLQVRDPWWIHCYWEVTQTKHQALGKELGDRIHGAQWALRVYDISFIMFDGSNAHHQFDISINLEAKNWYICASSGRSFCVDLGLKLSDGTFITVLRSNTVMTPLDAPSWVTDEEWFTPDELFAKLYGLSYGFGSSAGKGVKEIRQRLVSSPGLASMASPVRAQLKQKPFWLVVNTELIVYGATEPDAQVTMRGQPIKLRPDGTFSARFALPDCKLDVPIHATSSDGEHQRTITPIVHKKTE